MSGAAPPAGSRLSDVPGPSWRASCLGGGRWGCSEHGQSCRPPPPCGAVAAGPTAAAATAGPLSRRRPSPRARSQLCGGAHLHGPHLDASEASDRASPGAGSSPRPGLAATAGQSSEPGRGWAASDGCESARSETPSASMPWPYWPAPSSASTRSNSSHGEPFRNALLLARRKPGVQLPSPPPHRGSAAPGSLIRFFERHLRARNHSERTVGSYLESARLAEVLGLGPVSPMDDIRPWSPHARPSARSAPGRTARTNGSTAPCGSNGSTGSRSPATSNVPPRWTLAGARQHLTPSYRLRRPIPGQSDAVTT
jgi:hypothetical protein